MSHFFKVLFFTLLFHFNISNASETLISLSQDQVRHSIVETLKVLNEVYVFPEKAKEFESIIVDRMHKGAYDHIKTNSEFQRHISNELKEVSTDGHLGILLVKDEETEPTHVLVETEDKYKYNYAFQKLEILKGNVGYLKFNKFYQDEENIETVDFAMGFLKDTDAMIIDLRDNIGGSPELVRYILSHFFSEETLLWRVHERGDKDIYDLNSIIEIGSPKFKNNYPLFVLVGPDTASAAEMFSYTLKNYNRATIVGGKTRGVAHAVGAVKINKFFIGRFSMSTIINPITNTNFEVVGVQPDIKSSLDNSLNVAHSSALKVLKKTVK
jgi:C-terminal processing protease CtpA/Prc